LTLAALALKLKTFPTKKSNFFPIFPAFKGNAGKGASRGQPKLFTAI